MGVNGSHVEVPQAVFIKSAKPESEVFIMAFGGITLMGMLIVLWKGMRKQKQQRKVDYHQIFA